MNAFIPLLAICLLPVKACAQNDNTSATDEFGNRSLATAFAQPGDSLPPFRQEWAEGDSLMPPPPGQGWAEGDSPRPRPEGGQRPPWANNGGNGQRPPRREVFDAKNPSVHDPVLAHEDSLYYLFMTGMGVSVLTSPDLTTWTQAGSVFTTPPQWALDSVSGYRGHTWAPDIQHVGDRWLLYYSCSSFGVNNSAIGLATNKSLNPLSPDYKWEDQGMVIRSHTKQEDWNAIDPNLIFDQQGQPWLTWGSFWDGIQLVQLDSDCQTPLGQPQTIARRQNPKKVKHNTKEANDNAIEAPFIIYKDGYYYLFASIDLCCRGLRSNYKTVVGRSKDIAGPYVDKDGEKMSEGGGTVLIAETDDYVGVGHCGVYQFDGQWLFIAHGYAKANRGQSQLVLMNIEWQDGWPLLVPRT